jgi:hypothetical protein
LAGKNLLCKGMKSKNVCVFQYILNLIDISRLVFKSKVPNFICQDMSRLDVVRDPPHILKRYILKKSLFEISAHSALFSWLLKEICSF